MRTLAWQEVEDVLIGAAFLGCGGGGDLTDGVEQMRHIYEGGGDVAIASPGEVSDQALIACPYGVGAMTFADGDPYEGRPSANEHPSVLAVRALGQHVGADFAALICGELGGGSVADALYPAAILGIPVIDADPVGRAVPEIQHSMFAFHDLPIAPLAVVNEIGDTAVVTEVADDARAEALIRAMAVASRNAVWVADHALPWGDLRHIAIVGTLTLAEEVGRARRLAIERGVDVGLAVAAAGGGAVVFRGVVTSCEWHDADGFTAGETHVAGIDAWASSTYRVWFKNENLMAWRDDVADVMCPDLIGIVDDGGLPVANPDVAVGSRVCVVAFPSAPAWRTERGIASLGPAHFGFDVGFVPVEARL